MIPVRVSNGLITHIDGIPVNGRITVTSTMGIRLIAGQVTEHELGGTPPIPVRPGNCWERARVAHEQFGLPMAYGVALAQDGQFNPHAWNLAGGRVADASWGQAGMRYLATDVWLASEPPQPWPLPPR